MEALWGDLAGTDASKAHQGVHKLAAGAKQAMPFLVKRLKPAVRVDPKKIDGWLADLESEKFSVRQAATANLVKAGEQSVPPLKKLLASGPPLETRKRAEALLDQLTGGTLTSEQLQVVRAVEALEQIGTPEARRLLKTLTDGGPGALTTREAQAALDRLASGSPDHERAALLGAAQESGSGEDTPLRPANKAGQAMMDQQEQSHEQAIGCWGWASCPLLSRRPCARPTRTASRWRAESTSRSPPVGEQG